MKLIFSGGWNNASFFLQTACWSPDGSALLFATATEPIIYSVIFSPSPGLKKPAIGGSKVAITSADLSEIEVPMDDGTTK